MPVLTPESVYAPGRKPPKSEIIQLLKQIAGGTAGVGDYRGAWDSGTEYIASDLVESGGSIWYALVANDDVTPTEGATWTLFLPGASVSDGSITETKLADAVTMQMAKPVADRTAMLALSTTRHAFALLTQTGHVGHFRWDASDHSAAIMGSDIISSSIDSGTETITSVGHGLVTGRPVVVTAAVNGLSVNTLYYAIRVSADTFRLANSYANAIASTPFNLTGTSAMTVKQHFDPNKGIYVTPTSDISGASGAWVRMVDGEEYLDSWFGVVLDGATDSAEALLAGMLAATRLNNGRLRITGDSAFASHIRSPAGLRLSGDDQTLYATGTGYFWLGSSQVYRHVTFDFAGAANRFVLGEAVTDVDFGYCEVKNSSQHGINLQLLTERVNIHHCKIHDVTRSGVYAQGSAAYQQKDIEVSNNRIYNCGRSGIIIAGVGQTTAPQAQLLTLRPKIFGNTILNVGTESLEPNGIGIPYTDGARVIGNTIDEAVEHGIAGQETYRFVVLGNIAVNCDAGGVSFQSGFNPYNASQEGVIAGNVLTDNGYGLIFKDKNASIAVNGNFIRGNSTQSIWFTGSDGPSNDIAIFGNDLTNTLNENSSTNITVINDHNHVAGSPPADLS